MNIDSDQLDSNEFKSKMEKSFQRAHPSLSDSTNTIDASMQMVKKRRKKGRKIQKRITTPTFKPTSSQRSMPRASTPISCLKVLSAPELSQKMRTPATPPPPEKYSSPLFDSPSSYSIPESPIFNRVQNFDRSYSVATLPESFSSKRDDSFQNSQVSLSYHLNNEWDDFDHHVAQIESQLQEHISQREHHSQSPFSAVSLGQDFASPVHEHDFELSQPDEEFENQSEVNDALYSVYDQLRAQNQNQNSLTQQNRNISMQLRNFEYFVRDKMEEAEGYMKTKLTQIEESNLAVVNALNGIKRVEREKKEPEPIRSNGIERRPNAGLVMPKIPISRDVSLVLLNSALKDAKYMEQFVSEMSRVVTLYEYNPRKTVKSIMTKMFTLNLLIKYTWSARNTFANKPVFSSLTNVLKAIDHWLPNYMSEHDTRKEIKKFFKKIPEIYERQSIRYF